MIERRRTFCLYLGRARTRGAEWSEVAWAGYIGWNFCFYQAGRVSFALDAFWFWSGDPNKKMMGPLNRRPARVGAPP
jgi:hypothetical protein